MPPIKPIGSVRQSQAVTTFSIGAIVDFESGSYMPMGLDKWPATVIHGTGSKITEDRLAVLLGKKFFVLPPVKQSISGGADSDVKSEFTLPAVLFPEWMFCSHPECLRLGTLGNPFQFDAPSGKIKCVAHNQPTTPVRFVVSCRNGHIDDFPWVGWVHGDSGACNRPRLRLKSSGESLSLSALVVVCDGCNKTRTLEGAFRGELASFACRGRRIWLGDECECGEPITVLQRGSSSAHFQVAASALSIPPVSDTLSQVLDEFWSVITATPPETHRPIIEGVARDRGLSIDALLSAYQRRLGLVESVEMSQQDIRKQEYSALCTDVSEPSPVAGKIPHFENKIYAPSGKISDWFDLVGAVSRLREVRVLTGFTRVNPPFGQKPWADRSVAPLSAQILDWLPAFEIRGEGVFIRFRKDRLADWAGSQDVANRVQQLNSMYMMLCEGRGQPVDRAMSAHDIVIHTFAHTFIRQLAIECGYAAASIRERIYTSESLSGDDAMCGFMVYTGTTDSSGSLGGLVALAEQDRLEPIILRTIDSMKWCGSDPVCMEQSPLSMGDKVSGASCHSCVVLPETSCERGNRELDRAFTIGNTSLKGFFA